MTYSEWFSQYLSLYKRKISDKTRESYLHLAQLVAPIIGAKPLEAITPDDIQAAVISAEETAGQRTSAARLYAAACGFPPRRPVKASAGKSRRSR